MDKLIAAITKYLRENDYPLDYDQDEQLISFEWETESAQFATVISVADFGEPAMYALMMRTILPTDVPKARFTKLLDLMNRVNAAFPYGNLVMDTTIGPSGTVMAECQHFVSSEKLDAGLFEAVLNTSMEMATFYLPAIELIATKNASVDQALDRVLADAEGALADADLPDDLRQSLR